MNRTSFTPAQDLKIINLIFALGLPQGLDEAAKSLQRTRASVYNRYRYITHGRGSEKALKLLSSHVENLSPELSPAKEIYYKFLKEFVHGKKLPEKSAPVIEEPAFYPETECSDLKEPSEIEIPRISAVNEIQLNIGNLSVLIRFK